VLLESRGLHYLVDCGASSLVALRSAGVDPGAIDAVLLTHLHGDHFAGVPFLLLDGLFGGRSRPLVVAGPAGSAERIGATMELFYPGVSKHQRRFDLDYVDFTPGTAITIGALRVTPYEAVHPSGAQAFALRAELDGRTVACSGDTAWTDALVDAAAGADLFICESSSYDRAAGSHLDYLTLARHRPRIRCKRLVLTHMGSDMLSRVAKLPVEAAYDGLEIAL
jgi:ribonuclease BN (tRNA processing enzyme)